MAKRSESQMNVGKVSKMVTSCTVEMTSVGEDKSRALTKGWNLILYQFWNFVSDPDRNYLFNCKVCVGQFSVCCFNEQGLCFYFDYLLTVSFYLVGKDSRLLRCIGVNVSMN